MYSQFLCSLGSWACADARGVIGIATHTVLETSIAITETDNNSHLLVNIDVVSRFPVYKSLTCSGFFLKWRTLNKSSIRVIKCIWHEGLAHDASWQYLWSE